jgi:restriction system protein
MSIQTNLKGRAGELQTRHALKLFLDNTQYRVINNLLIKSGTITRQLDHVVISRYGIFVVETKYTDFWIYGSQEKEQWTKTFYYKKYPFPNPLHQNFAHTQTLAEFLKIENNKILPIVVFWGDCQIKTDMSSRVVKGIQIIDYIESKKQILFHDDEVERIYNDLVMLKLNTPAASILCHIDSVRKRYESNTVCPKCGGLLKERTARNGIRAGEKFLGCKNFPRCHYKKSLN